MPKILCQNTKLLYSRIIMAQKLCQKNYSKNIIPKMLCQNTIPKKYVKKYAKNIMPQIFFQNDYAKSVASNA